MKLKTLINDLKVTVKGSKETSITGISADSRTLAPSNLFIAKKGNAQDGANFIQQAINAGASAIVTDIFDPFLKITQIIHPNPAEIEAKLAARYYGHPAKGLFLIGVTGTKGKTTSSYLIRHFLDPKKKCGLIGTVETIIGENRHFSTLTTHDAITNQKLLKEMALKQCQAAVLEVSSHGLKQNRVAEIDFAIGVFTNLYPDHLDYHKTIDDYAASKKLLFAKAKQGIFNADSPWCEFMGKGFTFGIEKGDLRAENIVFTPEGTQFSIEGHPFHSPLIGRFNVYNALGAIAVGLKSGLTLSEMQALLPTFAGVPGRLERVGNVFVDFAHTGEALENVLQTLKEISKGKVIVVFGSGGNRDPGRRIGMGKAANALADISIVTSDNPRQEDPQTIANQILEGFSKKPLIELDRKKAIFQAVAMANKDDLILIAGKGHEKVQIFAHQTIPFDDLAVAQDALLQK